MIYLQKIISAWILPPGIIIVALLWLGAGMSSKNKKNASIVIILALLLYALSAGVLSSWIISSLESRYSLSSIPQGDVIVMLGGGATLNTPDIGGVGGLSGSSANRLLTAVRLYRQLNLPIIISGGQVYADSGNEAQIARRIMVQLGVADNKIITEEKSLNTKQNARYVTQILKERNWQRPILVTSAFHMSRSVYLFGRENIVVEPFPCDYQEDIVNSIVWQHWLPSGHSFGQSYIGLREYFGQIAAWLRLQ